MAGAPEGEKKSRLAGRIEEMAPEVYGLPKDERSRAGAEEMAGFLLTLSGAEVGMEEEPIRPRLRPGEGAGGAEAVKGETGEKD